MNSSSRVYVVIFYFVSGGFVNNLWSGRLIYCRCICVVNFIAFPANDTERKFPFITCGAYDNKIEHTKPTTSASFRHRIA